MCGRHHVQKVLVEIRADDESASLREAGVVKLLEERRDPGWNGRIEHHLGTSGRDLVNRLAVVSVIEGKVFLSDDRSPVGRDNLTDLLVHRVGPNIVR